MVHSIHPFKLIGTANASLASRAVRHHPPPSAAMLALSLSAILASAAATSEQQPQQRPSVQATLDLDAQTSPFPHYW